MNYYIEKDSKLLRQCENMFGFKGVYIRETEDKFQLMEAGFVESGIWLATPLWSYPTLQKATIELNKL